MRIPHPRIVKDPRPWPAALALISLLFIGSFLFYTERIVREVRAEAAVHSRMYALVQQGLLSLEPGADLVALVQIQAALTDLGVPVVVINAEGEPYAVENLPFEVDLAVEEDRQRVREFARELDRQNPPIVEPTVGTVHFGEPPVMRWLRWVPLLQVGTAVVILLIGFGLVRSNLYAERERMWAATARELAHQMGTPLSSLFGWVEVLSLPEREREELVGIDHIVHEIALDVERLDRVSRRFELIGKPPALGSVSVDEVLGELDRYLRPRVPRLGGGIRLRLRARRGLAPVRANAVLLVWALENLVRNALDAMAGRGGTIRVAAAGAGPGWVRFSVSDDGPGIPTAVRERIFDPGVTTKIGGWGVGLSLTRRIIEELHGGRIVVKARRGGGTVFEIELPVSAAESGDAFDGPAASERTTMEPATARRV